MAITKPATQQTYRSMEGVTLAFLEQQRSLSKLKSTVTAAQIGKVWEVQETMLATFAAMNRDDLEAATSLDEFSGLIDEATKLIRKELHQQDGIEELFGPDLNQLDLVREWLEPQIPWFLLTRLGQPDSMV